MSGGHFDYKQYEIEHIIDEIGELIKENNIPDQFDWCANYSDKTIDEFKKGIFFLKMAQIYAQRIDWLVSGDDGEECFHTRLNEELRELKNHDTEN